MKLFVLSAALVVLTGCSSNQQASLDQEKKDKIGYQCEKVYETGSTIPKKFCTTLAQREKMKKDSKEFTRELQKPVTTCQAVQC